MEDNDKTYGFVVNIYDAPQSIRSLWPATEEFIAEHPDYLHPNNAMGWLKDSSRKEHYKIANGYSTCHFWSNFEIGDMDFWRDHKYEEYFEHLDKSGGFFYERVSTIDVHGRLIFSGEMLPCIVLVWGCSRTRARSIGSGILAISMFRITTVRILRNAAGASQASSLAALDWRKRIVDMYGSEKRVWDSFSSSS